MDRWSNRVAVVTGASCGIGEAIAKDLVQAGMIVVAIARRVQRIEENRSKLSKQSQKDRFHPCKCDVTQEPEVRSTFKWITATFGGVDVLINNAGCIRNGNLIDIESSLIDEVINTNFKALIYCTQKAVSSMKERHFNGHLIHINSVAGHGVLDMGTRAPSVNVYSPTKFAVTAMNEVLRQELRNMGTKIKTTVYIEIFEKLCIQILKKLLQSISPGMVATEILSKDRIAMMGSAILAPEDISNAVLFALSTPPHVQIKEIIIKPINEEF